MKTIVLILLSLLVIEKASAQLYINGDITIQNGETLYADDTIQLGASATVTDNGILQSTKGIKTNQSIINTGATGFIITPVATGVTTGFDLGTTTTNNKISISHSSSGSVVYQLAVRDNVYKNPVNNTTPINHNTINKTWMVQPLTNASNSSIDLYWNAADEQTGFDRSNCNVAKWESSVSNNWNTPNGTSAASAGGMPSSYFQTLNLGSLNSGTYYLSVGDNSYPFSSFSTLNLTAFLQGLYLSGGTMTAAPFNADGVSPLTVADTISVELHEAVSPFTLVYTVRDTLDVTGHANIQFPDYLSGNYYYLSIKHRNSIETWSSNTVLMNPTTNYDFSLAANTAYGDNMADDGSGLFLIYCGDINQDGSVDFNDYPTLDIASSNGVLGYDSNDLNGDASVDFNDYPVIDINTSNGVLAMTP